MTTEPLLDSARVARWFHWRGTGALATLLAETSRRLVPRVASACATPFAKPQAFLAHQRDQRTCSRIEIAVAAMDQRHRDAGAHRWDDNLADPVRDGLASSLSRPGGNVTGYTFIAPELGPKRLQALRDLLPEITRVAALRHPGVYSERTMQAMTTEMEAASAKLGVVVQVFDAAGPNEFDEAFDAMSKARENALVVLPSPMFYVNYRRLVDLAAAHRLPTMYYFKEAVQAGGLMSYGADIRYQTQLAAGYVARILRGANPAELPIQQPTKFELLINLKTAKELGLTVPPLLLAQADEIIE